MIATAVLLVIVINPLFFSGIDACATENSEFSKWARSQSAAIDKDWQKAVERSSAAGPEDAVPVRNYGSTGKLLTSQKYRRSVLLAGKKNTPAQQMTGWNLGRDASGYIHNVTSGPFMPLTSRPRNGASRGVVTIDSPSSLTRGGNRRQPTNYVNIRVNSSVRSGSMRNSPSFGSRFSSSFRRGRASSFGRLGSTRSRRTR